MNGSNWSLSPSPFCESSCNMTLNVSTKYGVPPYTLSHPWASNTVTYGSYTYDDSTSRYTSMGDTSIILTVPGCSDSATTPTNVLVPVPLVIDACGDTVTGLLKKGVTLHPAPLPAFEYTESGNTVTFSDSSIGATSWKWEFGDETTGTDESPTHIYNVAGIYKVTLVVSNGTCTDSITKTIDVNAGIAGVNARSTDMHIYPNPSANSTTLEFTSDDQSVQLTLVNVLGQTLYSEILKPATANNYRTDLDLSALPAGVYEIVLTTSSYNVAKEVIKQE
jgi:PKD repeat protein